MSDRTSREHARCISIKFFDCKADLHDIGNRSIVMHIYSSYPMIV